MKLSNVMKQSSCRSNTFTNLEKLLQKEKKENMKIVGQVRASILTSIPNLKNQMNINSGKKFEYIMTFIKNTANIVISEKTKKDLLSIYNTNGINKNYHSFNTFYSYITAFNELITKLPHLMISNRPHIVRAECKKHIPLERYVSYFGSKNESENIRVLNNWKIFVLMCHSIREKKNFVDPENENDFNKHADFILNILLKICLYKGCIKITRIQKTEVQLSYCKYNNWRLRKAEHTSEEFISTNTNSSRSCSIKQLYVPNEIGLGLIQALQKEKKNQNKNIVIPAIGAMFIAGSTISLALPPLGISIMTTILTAYPSFKVGQYLVKIYTKYRWGRGIHHILPYNTY